jgi:hypothetical protein
MENRKTIVLVLYNGKDFGFRDVELIARHINNKWKSAIRPRIICLWDKASIEYDLGNIEIIPLHTSPGVVGTWSRIKLYAPSMEKYKPFLYVDLDTAVINSLENIFDLVKDESEFITLEDFWQKGQVATGLVWFPKDCENTKKVYESFTSPTGSRMDTLIRKAIGTTKYWQQLTKTIYDFKPKSKVLLNKIPKDADLVCFHGKPRIFEAVNISWVKAYISHCNDRKRVSVIIPYKTDRGWLQQAVNSVPKDCQLILSQGEGNWPMNFNKGLEQATGDYIKYLHEDDMLTPNCIEDSLKTFEETGADIIHGNAVEIYDGTDKTNHWKAKIPIPTLEDMLDFKKRVTTMHSVTFMFKKEVFEKIGGMNESDTMKSFEEFEFILRSLKAGYKIGYCNSDLGIYRRHPSQIIQTVDKEQRAKYRQELISIYQ